MLKVASYMNTLPKHVPQCMEITPAYVLYHQAMTVCWPAFLIICLPTVCWQLGFVFVSWPWRLHTTVAVCVWRTSDQSRDSSFHKRVVSCRVVYFVSTGHTKVRPFLRRYLPVLPDNSNSNEYIEYVSRSYFWLITMSHSWKTPTRK